MRQFIPSSYKNEVENGVVGWQSPSNIALVKYWGKRDPQLPENPSISFTLDACRTKTKMYYSPKIYPGNSLSFDVYFEGEKNEAFKPKIFKFFERIEEYCPFVRNFHFKIETENTFPHSSGIASSASGMSALALCLMSVEKELVGDMTEEFFNKKASFLARLGSGSACRSIEGDLIVWGEHDHIKGSNDLFGIQYPDTVHPNFKNYHDTILLIDKGEKQVSSTVGHDLMHGHPFAKNRFLQAHENLSKLRTILKEGDLEGFINIMESEALTLHAMMMTSNPYFILMKPNTLKVINKIWEFRKETGLPIGFTLDAGANVHILYPENDSVRIFQFIKDQLVEYCQNGHYICDRVGAGASRLKV
ncbi:diphosphomevalonate/mevalonate 3,5-bisphosphate decarboxylase family protein [Spongiivirga citrea]|uniref:Diphosphomevalonate decarboxylase n=1 Tax=Spongiivirga citrea TaxID=1481457 RepID=A0A6M0CJQ7_9FLAO|nr:diphosphomevalonate decarboxylase [Spongiivirga citrea]NER18166.1 diphosphomevalonate decarboxylase [Spongiivirga citrea]